MNTIANIETNPQARLEAQRLAIDREILGDYPPNGVDHFADLGSDIIRGLYVGADMAGMAAGKMRDSARTNGLRVMRLQLLAVASGYEGDGYGRAMLETMERSAHSLGACAMDLISATPLSDTFYEHFGYALSFAPDEPKGVLIYRKSLG